MPALHHILKPVLHIVAQIVETELIVGAVSHVAVVLVLAFGVVETVDDDADGKAEEFVDLAHPFGVALGQVIVDRDDVDAAGAKRVEIDRKSGDQRLAFAGLHFRDLALVQHHAADELDVEVALTERALGSFPHGGEGRHQNVVKRGAFTKLLFEFVGASAQFLVGKFLQFRFQRIDGVDARPIGADAAVIRGTEQLAGDSADHRFIFLPIWSAQRESNQRKMQRYLRLLQGDSGAPGYLRDIGGGGFVVNVSCDFTASLNASAISPLPTRADSASVRAGNLSPRPATCPFAQRIAFNGPHPPFR